MKITSALVQLGMTFFHLICGAWLLSGAIEKFMPELSAIAAFRIAFLICAGLAFSISASSWITRERT